MEYRHGQAIPGTQYRFIRELGAGGHGTVYSVEHTFLEAPAVMKLLHAELVDRGDLAVRMTREAKTLAKLRHPNIVEVRDGGISGESPGRPYFVMEALNGMPLRELLRHVRSPGGVGIMPTLWIMIGVLEGLEHAHRAGVIHRDIKPDNIFLHRTATDVTVPKILDFGIAHLLMAQRTTGRYFLGTPRYAAPEQLRGDTPSARTDIYAAGLVLYEMLTGEVPFADRKEVGDILQAHLGQTLPSMTEKCAEAPLYLANFVASMVAKNPDDRPPTAFAAAVGLREIRSRLEHQQAGVLNNTGFKTEPTPMENMLHAAARDDSGLAVTREEPLMISGAAPASATSAKARASGGVNDTVVDSPRSASGVSNPTVRYTPRIAGAPVLAPGPVPVPVPVDNSVAMANTEIGAPKRHVDRNAATNTAAPIVPRSRPNHDTEMLLRGLSFDPAAYAETEQAPPRNEERTTGVIAMSRNASVAATPPVAARGMSPLAKQVTAFCLTLLVFAAIGVPVLWNLKKEYGARDDVTKTTAAAPPPAAAPAPPPVAAVPSAAPSASASATALAVTATTTATPAPAPAPKPRAAQPVKPKIDPNDPSTVPMD